MGSDSMNYISIIKSNIDMNGDMAGGSVNDMMNIEDQMQLEQIQNFAMMLMEQRRVLNGEYSQRPESFNTDRGMAYSSK